MVNDSHSKVSREAGCRKGEPGLPLPSSSSPGRTDFKQRHLAPTLRAEFRVPLAVAPALDLVFHFW